MKMVDTKKKEKAVRAVPSAGVRVNRTGRRTYTDEYKHEVVSRCSVPGASVSGIAVARGINPNLVRKWIRIRQQPRAWSVSSLTPLTMLPVTIAGVPPSATAVPVTAATPKRPRPGSATIEIEIYGARIHMRSGVEVEALRAVLEVLRQR